MTSLTTAFCNSGGLVRCLKILTQPHVAKYNMTRFTYKIDDNTQKCQRFKLLTRGVMSEGKSFNCPNCGSSLSANGNDKSVICRYCGSNVIVPEELLGVNSESHEPLPPEFDLFSPSHVEWLVTHGADATVKVDVVKERKGMTYKDNPIFDVMFSGKKADGDKFESICTINMPAKLVPKPGTTLKVKYKKAADPIDDTSDYAIQINGQFVYSVLDNPDELEGLM